MPASGQRNSVAAREADAARLRRGRRSRRLLVLLAVAGLLASVGIYYSLLVREQVAIEAEFLLTAERQADAIRGELDDNIGLVGALQAFYEGSQVVERDEFAFFANSLVKQYRSVHELAWVPCVPVAQRPAVEESMRLDVPGSPGILEADRNRRFVPASRRSEYYPVRYLAASGEPILPSGFDLGSVAAFADAVNEARDRGTVAASDERFVQPNQPLSRAVLIAAPVYRNHRFRPATVAQRRERFEGVVVGVFHLGTIFDSALVYFEPAGIDVRWIEWSAEPNGVAPAGTESPARAVRVLHVWFSAEQENAVSSGALQPGGGRLSHLLPLKVPGRQWWLHSTPARGYLTHRRTWLPPTVLWIGIFVTGFGTMYLATLFGRTAEVEELVERRTAELQQANASLQREIAVRERAENVFRESQSLYSSLVENLPVFVLRKNLEGRFTFANRAFCEAVGKTAEEIQGKTDCDLYPPELAEKYRKDDHRVAETGERFECIEENERDGRLCYMQVIKIPIADSAGNVVGVQAVFWDVTEHKRYEVQMAAARDAAEAANRAKSVFLANMSHEIRTPMNAIIGMADLLQNTSLTSEQQEYLRTVQDSGDALLMVINDILDFSKIDAGRLDLEQSEFDLHESLGDTMKSLALRAHDQHLELTYRVAPEVPRVVIGDRIRLRQVLVNLIGNAIKFTRQGEVVLEAAVASRSADGVGLHFTVRDTGIGIASEKLQVIFEAFEQADSTTTREFGGTGLGLAISSRLAQLMGGRVWAESELGRGSTFHFTAFFGLPAEQPPAPSVTLLDRLPGLRVLVVDDNATNRRILEQVLRGWAMEPTAVAGAEEAIRLLEEHQKGPAPFQLVLTDANMPGMDGFALVQQIKGREHLADTVIMMLSSGDHPSDVARCERMGLHRYLTKPVKSSELLDAIVRAVTPGSAPAVPAESAGIVSRLRPLRILLAEDSLVNQRLVMGLLGKQGHSIVVAGTGREALAAAFAQPFDVVLMDVQMPEMDGLQATAELRAEETRSGRRRTPVVAMTAHAMSGDRQRCLNAGMDEYIAKPLRAQRLFEVLESVVAPSLVKTAEGEKAFPESVTPPGEAPCTADSGVVDWSKALRAAGGDPALLRAIAEAFLTDGPCEMAAIRRAVVRQDAALLRRASHTLKGSIEYFGASRAFELAFELEQRAKDNDLSLAARILPELESEMDRVLRLLVEYTRR